MLKRARGRNAIRVLFLLVVLGVFAELTLRAAGYADLPLYRADPILGYIPQARSSGTFARRVHWAFNDRSMRMDRRCEASKATILLIGDSLVHGGTILDQKDIIGARLSTVAGQRVCSLGAGSWAFENELRAALVQTDLEQFGAVVFVLNAEDFVKPSVWASEITHPTHRPSSILLTSIMKKSQALEARIWQPPVPKADDGWKPVLEAFLSRYHGKVLFVLYPRRADLRRRDAAFETFLARLGHRATVLDVSSAKQWAAADYFDQIHPNRTGSLALAHLIADRLGTEFHTQTR